LYGFLGHQPLARQSAADDGRGLPVDAAQTGLFEALPDAVAIPAHLLARRYCGRFPHGPASRNLLPRLLLALDGSSVRGRRDSFWRPRVRPPWFLFLVEKDAPFLISSSTRFGYSSCTCFLRASSASVTTVSWPIGTENRNWHTVGNSLACRCASRRLWKPPRIIVSAMKN
jgi:hypothetical protein